MAIDAASSHRLTIRWFLQAMAMMVCISGCGTGPLVGLVYTDVKLPLTRNLIAAPVPEHPPGSDRIIEIKEPFSGLGMYTRVDSNAIGDIAMKNGVEPFYFADQEVFSVLGIWKSHRVFLYGQTVDDPEISEEKAAAP